MRLKSISNLEDKLDGKLPVDRLELLVLINSWGRSETFTTHYNDNKIKIEECEAKECYDLSKLDVSQIEDMSDLFKNSNFSNIYSLPISIPRMESDYMNGVSLDNGNISNWDVSNVTSMEWMFYSAKNFNSPLNSWNISKVIDMRSMFYGTEKFNQPLNDWDVSNVKYMSYMFANTLEFNQDISKWNVSNVTNMYKIFFSTKAFNQNISSWNLDNIINCDYMFYNAKAFRDKYNNGKPLPYNTKEIKEWFINNRDKMNDIDIEEKHGEEVDDFF